MAALLDGPLIDAVTRTIRAHVPSAGAPSEPAGIEALISLLDAMVLWTRELTATDDLEIDDGLRAMLEAAPGELRPAIQLTVQTLIRDHAAAPGSNPHGSGGVGLHANLLRALIGAAAVLGPSPWLARHLDRLGARLIAATSAAAASHELAGADVMAAIAALRAWRGGGSPPPAAADLLAALEAATTR